MKRGKGLSTIVSTLLILLLVFVAVAILWVVVRNVINQGTEQVSLGKFTLDLKIDQVSIDESANEVFVRVKRNTGEGEFVGLKIIVSDDENSEIFNVNGSLEVYEKQEFNFNLQNIDSSKIKKIQVAPVFRLSSGKEVVGDVKDTWESSEGISNFVEDEGEIVLPPANQTSQQCIVDLNCTTDYYSANYCHTSGDVYRNYYDFFCNATNQCDYTQTPQIVQDCNSTQTCSNGVCVNNAVIPTCYDGIQNGGETGIDCGGSCPACNSASAESSLLSGVQLIHDQTFLIPENAVTGDTVGDLNLMWVGSDQNIQFSLVNNDGGRFSIQKLTGRTTVSNHNLNYDVRISVASASFDYDSQLQRQITVRATDDSGRYNDAVITIKLSRAEDTIFIDPTYSGTETGSRTQPYNSWNDVVGGSNTGLSAGKTYLQKRGTTTQNMIKTYSSGNPTQHIVFGAYGVGERPSFDGTSYSGWKYASGIGLGSGTGDSGSYDIPVSYYDFYSLKFENWWAGIVAENMGTNHCNFVDLYFTRTRGMGLYLRTDSTTPQSTDMLYYNIDDSYSEYSEGEADNEYGFKTESGKTVFNYCVARFNKDMGFAGGFENTFNYCQVYDSGWGIKAHGDNAVVRGSLIQDNEIGLHVGNYYQSRGDTSKNFNLVNSLVKNNGEGMRVEQDASLGIIDGTEFSGNGRAIGFYRDGSFTGAPSGYTIKNSNFNNNEECIYTIYGPPYPNNITIAYNLFYDNSGIPITISQGSDIKVYNNVFYNNEGSYDVQVSGSELFTARNNILQDGISASTHANHIMSNNVNYQSSCFVNPGSRNFHLNSGCSAINAGVNVGFTKDYDGKSISGNPDAGAFEY